MAFVSGTVVGTSANIAAAMNTQRHVILKAGDYTINSPLPRIRSGQTIRGSWPGTRLLVTYETAFGLGATSGALHIDVSAERWGIHDLEIWYPNILASVTPTIANVNISPWAIYGDRAAQQGTISNVLLANPYRGIKMMGNNYYIENVTGMPSYRGIEVDTCGNEARLVGVRFNQPWTAQSGALWTWQKEQGIAFVSKRCDGFRAVDCFCLHYTYGFYFDGSDYTGDGGAWTGTGTGGNIVGGGADDSVTGLYVNVLGPYFNQPVLPTAAGWAGISVSGGFEFGSGVTGSPLVYITSPSQARMSNVKLTGCRFFEAGNYGDTTALIYNQFGNLTMENCDYYSAEGLSLAGVSTGRPLFVRADNGILTMVGGYVGGNAGEVAVRATAPLAGLTIRAVGGLGSRVDHSAMTSSNKNVDTGMTVPTHY